MTNSYHPDSSMPTGVPGLMPRSSSYASVVSGAASSLSQHYPSRSGAFANLPSHPDHSYDHSRQIPTVLPRYNSRNFDMDFNTNGSSHGRSWSGGRGGQLPSWSSAFGALANGHGYGVFGSGHADHFFVPSYLKDSKYVWKLEDAHRAKVSAHREGPTANSSQSGPLSTSGSSINLHTKAAPSYRGITYDVIEKAPPLEDEALSPLPSRWNTQDKFGGLEVLSDGQEVKFTGAKSPADRDHEACSIRADHFMPPQCGIYYFEVTIISRRREESSIGIGFSSKGVTLSRLPGWEPESWAYHGDDGNSFCCQTSGKHYGPPFTAGDIIGCGVNFRTGSAFFTKNGDHLGTAFREIKGKLFPSVGMKKTGEHIRANFGQSPFVFDIDGMMSVSANILFPFLIFIHVLGESSKMDSSQVIQKSSNRAFRDPDGIIRSFYIQSARQRLALQRTRELLNSNLMEEPRLGRIEQDRHEERTLNAAQSLVALSTNRMACQQDEQKQIRTQIEAASTSTLAPKMSETELIQKLILQFLQHDGYVETARAFAEEVHAEKKALSLDPNAVVSGFDVKEDEDAGHRQRIRKSILEGDVDKALKHTNAYYPQVLKDNEHVYFRLRCLKFIEMTRQSAEMLKHTNSQSSHGTKKANGHSYYEEYVDQDMDLDDQSNSNSWDRMETDQCANIQEEYKKLTEEMLDYGQLLQAEFKDDPRREVKKALDEVFALMAYQDPFSSKEVSHLLDPSSRVAVAEELNSAILLSLGKSSSASLEQLIQQTTVLLEDLREGGGPGAFVNIDDYVNPDKPSSKLPFPIL